MTEKTFYSQYFAIDDKYYAVVNKALIDAGKVQWDSFYPHETFLQLLGQTINMLSGKEDKSIWVEGTYGTGKSHATLTLKSLLEVPEEAVRKYFQEYNLSQDLCERFLAARSESMNGKLIVVHRIGSSNIKNDDDLVWAVQDSVATALQKAGITNMATGTMKDALIHWINKDSDNKDYLAKQINKEPLMFSGMDLDTILHKLQSNDESTISNLMDKLIKLQDKLGLRTLDMDMEKLAKWLEDVIDQNHLHAIVFLWDEFSEYFKNCQNSLTGFQTLAQLSFTKPFYFIIVTHESDSLITNSSDRSKISDRFMSPRVHIKLPDNMAFKLMAQAMKTTSDAKMLQEWEKVKKSLNRRLLDVRTHITEVTKKHKAHATTALSDDDLQQIIPLHPYAALILKYIACIFTSNQRSMFDFIVARDPEDSQTGTANTNAPACHAFRWFINHYNPEDGFMTIDMLWDIHWSLEMMRICEN